MHDDILNARLADRRRGMSGRALAATFAAALLLGAVGTAWVSWHYGWLNIDSALQGGAQPQPALSQPQTDVPAAEPAIPAASAARIAALEARLAELDREAKVASGHAGRAESLLIAFAARRAIERGEPLGFLENQLRLRFGESQPQSVQRVIEASAQPVTLPMLAEQLALIEPQLALAAPDQSTWDWLRQEAAALFVIRHDTSPSPVPEKRLARARQYLAGGRVSAAIDEVARMPGRDAARNWLAMAQSYIMTERALDLLENAAILQPQVQAAAQVPQVQPAVPLPTQHPPQQGAVTQPSAPASAPDSSVTGPSPAPSATPAPRI